MSDLDRLRAVTEAAAYETSDPDCLWWAYDPDCSLAWAGLARAPHGCPLHAPLLHPWT